MSNYGTAKYTNQYSKLFSCALYGVMAPSFLSISIITSSPSIRHNSKHTEVAITGRCGPIRHNKHSCVEFAQSAEIRAILTAHVRLIKCHMRQRF